jgi:hypothetical protein
MLSLILRNNYVPVAPAIRMSWDLRHELTDSVPPTALSVAVVAGSNVNFCDPLELFNA